MIAYECRRETEQNTVIGMKLKIKIIKKKNKKKYEIEGKNRRWSQKTTKIIYILFYVEKLKWKCEQKQQQQKKSEQLKKNN